MRRLTIVSAVLSLVVLGALEAPSARAASFVPGEVVFLLPSESSSAPGQVGLASERLGAVFQRHSIQQFERIDRGTRFQQVARPQVWRIRSDASEFDPEAVAAELRASGAVLAACPNYKVDWHATVPNDPFLYLQWHVNDGGDADIDLPEAWDIAQGDSSVVIAIIDTGVDIGHPDLQPNIHRNWAEIPNNSIDDDGNGYVDDVNGWDMGVDDNDPSPQPTFDMSGVDVAFHGTFVAGIAGALPNNATGIAGAGWNCRIMPLKIGDALGETTLDIVAEAITYAIDNGASIINTSFGVKDEPSADSLFQALAAYAESEDVLWTASAGNDSVSVVPPPAVVGTVLSVGAIDQLHARAYFSNYGADVDICAPGDAIWSSINRNYTFDGLSQLVYQLAFGWNGIDPYMLGSGTSAAAPLVAGVAGLVRAHNPSMTAAQVRAHLIATAETITTDHPIGPLVDAFAAVNTPTVGVSPPSLAGLYLEAPVPNPFTSGTSIYFALPEASPVRITVYDAAGRRIRRLVDGALPAGRHQVTWDARSESGVAVAGGVYFLHLSSPLGERTQRVALLR
jgi:subtilisin family serine protease